ncbi:MAG: hypothetical protein FJW88_14945 [Actinobacteria bacterium]|nr:hypothetical protein [Actinomycetota bacterium]
MIRDSDGRLGILDGRTGARTWSTTMLPLYSWQQVTLEVTLAGADSAAQVLLNGTAVPGLRLTANLGATRISAIELGDVGGSDKTYAMFFDDVKVT